MNKLTNFISKWPVKILMVTLALLVVIGIGATTINLKTGNDTLISDQTDIYKENESYQNTFGKDPIIIIFDDPILLSQETLTIMHEMQTSIESLDGVFAINSPVTLINQMTKKMYTETETGLGAMSTGLLGLSNQLTLLGNQLSTNELVSLDEMTLLTTNIQGLIDGQNQLETGMINMFDVIALLKVASTGLLNDLTDLKVAVESDPLLIDESLMVNQLLVDTNKLDNQLNALMTSDGLKVIPANTSVALNQILTAMIGLSTKLSGQKDMLQTLSTALLTMGTNLGQTSNAILQIKNNFNAFKPGFPSSGATLDMMVYDQGVIRNQFNGFLLNDHQVRMVVVLNGDVTDKQIDSIYTTLVNALEGSDKINDVLISGKPILDRSIKSSMMSSMQFMMTSAVVIMIVILALIYRVRMRLIPIFMILIAVVVTVGMMGWLNIGLTMVSMAVFPVLIGLGIDYFIQFQTRYEEERQNI